MLYPLAHAWVANVRVGLVAIGGAPHSSTFIEHGLGLVPSTLVDGGGKAVVAQVVAIRVDERALGIVVLDAADGLVVELHRLIIGGFLAGAPGG